MLRLLLIGSIPAALLGGRLVAKLPMKGTRRPMEVPSAVNVRWSLDFVSDARYELSRWREDYKQVRLHSVLGNLSPAELVKKLAQQKLAA